MQTTPKTTTTTTGNAQGKQTIGLEVIFTVQRFRDFAHLAERACELLWMKVEMLRREGENSSPDVRIVLETVCEKWGW